MKKLKKRCVCGKIKHKSKRAAEAQLKGIKKRLDAGGSVDYKDPETLHVYMCTRNKVESVWHVGHSNLKMYNYGDEDENSRLIGTRNRDCGRY